MITVTIELTEAEASEYISQCSGRVDEALADCLGDTTEPHYSGQRKVLDAITGAAAVKATPRP